MAPRKTPIRFLLLPSPSAKRHFRVRGIRGRAERPLALRSSEGIAPRESSAKRRDLLLLSKGGKPFGDLSLPKGGAIPPDLSRRGSLGRDSVISDPLRVRRKLCFPSDSALLSFGFRFAFLRERLAERRDAQRASLSSLALWNSLADLWLRRSSSPSLRVRRVPQSQRGRSGSGPGVRRGSESLSPPLLPQSGMHPFGFSPLRPSVGFPKGRRGATEGEESKARGLSEEREYLRQEEIKTL